MDPMLVAAARALAAGAPLDALNQLAVRDDAAALALRGSALAQLGDLDPARRLLLRAARAFGRHDPMARARCEVALADVALAARDLQADADTLEAACVLLAGHGDPLNATHGRLLAARRLTLLGQPAAAAERLRPLEGMRMPPAWQAMQALVRAELALRCGCVSQALHALAVAQAAADSAAIPALSREVASARAQLALPAATLRRAGTATPITAAQIEALRAEPVWLVDLCRGSIHARGSQIALSSRPVLLALAVELAQAWPRAAARGRLIERLFRIARPDETLRARLRVEVGRLRALMPQGVAIAAQGDGYALRLAEGEHAAVLAWPDDEPHGVLLALLADGQLWPSSALALSSGLSQRSVQRGLDALAARERVQPYGRGRQRRWRIAPLPGFAPGLLLPPLAPPP